MGNTSRSSVREMARSSCRGQGDSTLAGQRHKLCPRTARVYGPGAGAAGKLLQAATLAVSKSPCSGHQDPSALPVLPCPLPVSQCRAPGHSAAAASPSRMRGAAARGPGPGPVAAAGKEKVPQVVPLAPLPGAGPPTAASGRTGPGPPSESRVRAGRRGAPRRGTQAADAEQSGGLPVNSPSQVTQVELAGHRDRD